MRNSPTSSAGDPDRTGMGHPTPGEPEHVIFSKFASSASHTVW